jgi:transposase
LLSPFGVMKQYPTDLRERLVGALDAGFRPTEAAQYFGVTTRTMARWRQRRRLAGSAAPLPRTGRPPKIGPERYPALRAHAAAFPDATLADQCDRWATATGVRVSQATMSRLFAKRGIAHKKRP